MSKSFNRLAALSVDQRWFVILLVSIITTVAVIGHRDPNLLLQLFETTDEPNDNASVVAPEDDRPRRQVPNVSPFSLSGGDVVVVVQGEGFFNADCAKALRQVVEDLEELDQVRNVLWMDRVPTLNIFGLPEPLFPRSEASANRFAAAKEKAMKHPLVGGQLLSGDGRTLLLLLGLDYNHVLDDSDATTLLRETAEATVSRFTGVDLTFQVTGHVPAALAAIEAHEANQLKYQLIGYGMIFVMTLILFRGIRAVMIVAAAPALGVFWTIGMVRYLGYEHNPLVDVILPVLVSLVGLTDGVHLMVQIRKLRAGGLPRKKKRLDSVFSRWAWPVF